MPRTVAFRGSYVKIREAGTDDASAISQLILPVATRQIAYEFDDEGQRYFLDSLSPQAIRGYINDDYRYYLAYLEGKLVGVIGMRGLSHIYHLFVARDMQGRGVARRLWNIARQHSLGTTDLTEFTVYSSRFAEGFYRHLGFHRTGAAQTRNGVTCIPMRMLVIHKQME